ncbi:MAG: hypothetical protein LBT25_03990 [Candidatus Symbiothrix sp.]|jgi:hypothetical protein|nr:hypothetical protein [Candidatus Symbiothrix sp.]
MKNIGSKIVLFFFLSGVICQLNTQAQTGTWKIRRAYQNATIVAETPHLVFAVYDGSLLSYNPEDKEVRTYSSKEGLHDIDIQYMAYSQSANALVLLYTNGNIDIFMKEGDVYNLSFIKDNTFIQDKTAYNLEIIGDYAYISTAFGIVAVDVKRKEIKDTYRTGAETKSICRQGDYLYAATVNGIKKASVSANLLDKDNWKDYDETAMPEYLSAVTKLCYFKDRLVFMQWDHVYYVDPNGAIRVLNDHTIRDIKVLNAQLVLLSENKTLYFYSDFDREIPIAMDAYDIDCLNSANRYWLASGNLGVMGITKQADVSEFDLHTSGIIVDSPKRNETFFLKYTAGKLLVVGGGREGNRNNTAGTLMVLENGKWNNFDEDAISEKTGLPCEDFMSVEVDPADPGHYFVASWGEGLYEFKDNEFVNLYNHTNSSLQFPNEITSNQERYVRVDGLMFDGNNNLYMVNGGVPNGLSVFIDQKEWKSLYSQPMSSTDPNKILISSDNKKWMNIFRGSRAGIVVLDDKNTIENDTDDAYYSASRFVDQQGNEVGATGFYDMKEDFNGHIWVGTDNGPITFSSAEQVGRGECYRPVSTDVYGGNFYLLEGLKISSIAIDGGNRKWVGTDGDGVFVVEQPSVGASQYQVRNFTTKNSHLISDKINAIAINQETGEVFIATDKGLCSYMGEAIAGKTDYSNVYADPNPVRPASDSQVVITGLMQNSTVKITDMTGNLIKEGVSLGGRFIWNCTNRNGAIVKAGIYLVFAATPDGKQGVVSKIMVIK